MVWWWRWWRLVVRWNWARLERHFSSDFLYYHSDEHQNEKLVEVKILLSERYLKLAFTSVSVIAMSAFSWCARRPLEQRAALSPLFSRCSSARSARKPRLMGALRAQRQDGNHLLYSVGSLARSAI